MIRVSSPALRPEDSLQGAPIGDGQFRPDGGVELDELAIGVVTLRLEGGVGEPAVGPEDGAKVVLEGARYLAREVALEHRHVDNHRQVLDLARHPQLQGSHRLIGAEAVDHLASALGIRRRSVPLAVPALVLEEGEVLRRRRVADGKLDARELSRIRLLALILADIYLINRT